MAFCEECGARLPEDAGKCPYCGTAVSQPSAQAGSSLDARQRLINQSGTASYSAPRSGSLVLAENEKVVRQYQCSNIKRPRCTGYLTVTNKRILFQARAATSRVSKEVVLDSVSGLDCYYGMNINIGGIILGALLALLGLFFLFGEGRDSIVPVGLVLLALGVVLIIFSIRKSFFLSIFSSKANGSPISLGAGARTLAGNGALYALVSEPTADTDRMLNELGALVQDLQTLGDHAIEKWSR